MSAQSQLQPWVSETAHACQRQIRGIFTTSQAPCNDPSVLFHVSRAKRHATGHTRTALRNTPQLIFSQATFLPWKLSHWLVSYPSQQSRLTLFFFLSSALFLLLREMPKWADRRERRGARSRSLLDDLWLFLLRNVYIVIAFLSHSNKFILRPSAALYTRESFVKPCISTCPIGLQRTRFGKCYSKMWY